MFCRSDSTTKIVRVATVMGTSCCCEMLAKLCPQGRELAGIEKSAKRNVAVAGYAGMDPP